LKSLLVRLWLILSVGTLACGTWVGQTAFAETRPTAPLRLTTSPLPVQLDAKPGQTVSTDIKIKQDGGDTEQLKVTLMKFSSSGTSGQPALAERGPGDDYFDWVKFDRPTFTAPSGVWQTIKMTVAVPKQAAFSYYYAVVFSRVGDELKAGNGKSGIQGGTAVLVMMDVNQPGAKRSLQLLSFGVKHRVVEFLPEDFTVSVKNDGNVFVRPGGVIFINQGSRQVGMVEFNEGLGTVLSSSQRIYDESWNYGFPYFADARVNGKVKQDKKGNDIQTLSWGLPEANTNGTQLDDGVSAFLAKQSKNPLANIRFGQYTAHLFAVYQDGYGHDVPLESTISFWVIPWRALLVILLLLLLVGFGLYANMRKAAGWVRIKRKYGRRGK